MLHTCRHTPMCVMTTSRSVLTPPRGTYLRFVSDRVYLVDELAVGLEEKQQLEVQFVQPPAKLQLLQRSGVNIGG